MSPEFFFILGLAVEKGIGQLVVVVNELTKRCGMVPVRGVLRIDGEQSDIGRMRSVPGVTISKKSR